MIASHVRHLGPSLEPSKEKIELNPAPPSGQPNPGCLRVGVLDSGVNYALSQIAERLAYDGAGRMIGHDFWENDERPYDYGFQDFVRDPRISAFNPRHHGTGVASILLRDAPDRGICLAAYRYNPGDRDGKIGDIVDRLAAEAIKIVVLASSRERPWPEFKAALEKQTGLLVVVAAGNHGRDLGQRPLYPPAYRLPNVIVVGATDSGGALWPQSNHGAGVDVAVPAVNLPGFDHSGASRSLTGTSLAAPRVAALAAILWRAQPRLSASEVRTAVLGLADKEISRRAGPVLISEEAFQRLLQEASRPGPH
jgi:subtilisin family serine protease